MSEATGEQIADPMISLRGVGKTYPDGTTAVGSLDLDVPRGSLVALVGPSGCGKSTTLKMVNRLIEPTSGQIILDGEDVTKVDPVKLRQGIGYVIQQTGLFPHRTIRENVATVPAMLGWDKQRTAARVEELLDVVGLDPSVFGDRYPHQLSGGQRQRVGVARAIAADPPVLLMDEPFGAVDPVVRGRLQDDILRIREELGITAMMVTHDIDEAAKMGDLVAVLNIGGVLAQYDKPAVVLGAPADDFVAEFVGSDRGLRRLAVTEIEESDLVRVPAVDQDATLAEAADAMARAATPWAVVLDGEGNLHGWISRELATGSGTVRDRARRMDAWVDRTTPLKEALSVMLRHDAGWVAVLDDGRLVGILTPDSLHAALRRSVRAEETGDPVADVELETVTTL